MVIKMPGIGMFFSYHMVEGRNGVVINDVNKTAH